LSQELVEQIDFGRCLSMLLNRGKNIKSLLINHLLLFELESKPDTDRLMQSHGLLLNTESVSIDLLDHSECCL
jgi:hypothetical protein